MGETMVYTVVEDWGGANDGPMIVGVFRSREGAEAATRKVVDEGIVEIMGDGAEAPEVRQVLDDGGDLETLFAGDEMWVTIVASALED